jgi:threonine/homoserine/homoserine lactone efflux protein
MTGDCHGERYIGAVTLTAALLGFAAVAALMTLVPGIDTALVLRTSITRSRRAGFATAAGIQTGVLFWGATAGLGATAVLAASETAYRILTWAGAAYLILMGLTMALKTFRGDGQTLVQGRAAEVEASRLVQGSTWRGWITGLVTNLLNPKVGVFYLATIPQFMAAGVPPLVMGLLLACVHVLCGVIWCSALVLGGAALGSRLTSARFVRWLDRITGGVLIAFGAKLAWDVR